MEVLTARILRAVPDINMMAIMSIHEQTEAWNLIKFETRKQRSGPM